MQNATILLAAKNGDIRTLFEKKRDYINRNNRVNLLAIIVTTMAIFLLIVTSVSKNLIK
ncbi:MAG: hypothetical protein M1300_05660 [Epsilonproteobacteria bacterium]|nr:hypothetical protein [Campylobacterota bacterium]